MERRFECKGGGMKNNHIGKQENELGQLAQA